MPGLNKLNRIQFPKPGSAIGDVSIEDEYQYNLFYLQHNKVQNRVLKNNRINTTGIRRPSQLSSRLQMIISDPGIQSIQDENHCIETSNISRNQDLDCHSSKSIPPDKIERLHDIEQRSTLSFENECKSKSCKEAPTICDNSISKLHAHNNIFVRRASVCSLQNSSTTHPKVARGKTLASFDRNKANNTSKNMQSGTETCFQCEKRVYPLDRLSTGDRVYHKACFRCNECNRTLSATNFAKLDGIIFCKPHYIEKFRRRGKYEAVVKPGSSSCSMTPVLKNDAPNATAVPAETGASD